MRLHVSITNTETRTCSGIKHVESRSLKTDDELYITHKDTPCRALQVLENSSRKVSAGIILIYIYNELGY